MKVEIEIPDLEEVISAYDYCNDMFDDSINGKDIKKHIINVAIDKFIRELYHDILQKDNTIHSIKNAVNSIIEKNQEEIIEAVINKVSDKMLLKKQIVSEMPKKSEIAGINKEWEDYFVELIDKAIARRFSKFIN